MLAKRTSKIFVIILCLVVGLLAIFNSCKKDQKSDDPITSVKNWYLSNNLNGGTSLQSSKGTSQQTKQEVDWVNARAFKLDNGTDVVSVPVKLLLGKAKLGGSYILLIDKFKNNYRIQVAYNDEENYFKGNITDMEMTAVYKETLNANLTGSPTASSRDKLMTVDCTNWFMITTYYDASGNFAYSSSRFLYQTCSGDLNGYEDNDDGGPRGPVDCIGVYWGTAYLTDCGCVGGTTGITDCTLGDTTNKVTNPCINTALIKALSKNAKSKVKDLMHSTFLANSIINLTFYSLPVPISSPNANADAYTRQANALNPNEQIIVFNENKMLNTSEEYNVATVYHEVFHAYLSILFTKDTNGILMIPDQHENMVFNYLNVLTRDLVTLYPNMSESDALALSWGGLQKTSRYSLISDTQRAEIEKINLKYSTKPGPGVTNTKGTYCQ